MPKRSRHALELTRDMGRAVIDHLSALGPLPRSGYLAGQAVSSAVFQLFADDGEGLVVYNDLDVFHSATARDLDIAEWKQRTLSTVGYQGCSIQLDDYQHMGFEVTGSYDVVGSHREGLVNHVSYTRLGSGLRRAEAPLLTLIKAFDLNVTQVGVDLESGALIWSSEFEEFCRTRQLLISNVQTPHHTAMRWFKKLHELPGLFGNDEAAMELVTLMSFTKGLKGSQRMIEKGNLRWRFGAKNAGMYACYERQLAPYFALVEDDDDIFHLNPTGMPDADLVAIAKRYPTRTIPLMMNTLRAPRRAPAAAKVASIIFDDLPGEHTIGLRLGSLLVQGDGYLRGNVAMHKLAEVAQQIKAEPLTLSGYVGLCATEQIKEAAQWRALEARYGQWIYGFMEQLMFSRRQQTGHDAEYWGEVFEIEDTSYLHPDHLLQGRKPLEWYCGDFHCTELLTRGALMAEGRTLHHCVGGYANLVSAGTSRIFSIRHPDKAYWSTVEFVACDEHGNELEMRQNLGLLNALPHDDSCEIAWQLLEVLNEVPEPLPDPLPAALPPPIVHVGLLGTVAGYLRAIYTRW